MYRILLLGIMILVGGCQTVGINVSHVNTDKGFLNSRLLDIGHLFLLDTKDDSLTEIAKINLKSIRSSNTFPVANASNVRGVTLNGDVSAIVEAAVKVEVASKAFIKIMNGTRVEYHRVYNDLSKKIEEEITSGNDVGTRWELREAAKPDSSLRLVLVSGAITADKSEVGYDKSLAANGSLKIPTGRRGSVNVKIVGASTEVFEGKAVPVFLQLRVIKVFYNEKGNFDFKPDRKFRPTERLTAALRAL